VPRTPAELESLRRVVVNALGLKVTSGQSLDDIVSLQETAFQPAAIDERIEALATETRVQSWIETASRYVAVAVALGAFYVFFRMLRRQRPEPVPVELLNAAAAGRNGARANGNSAAPTPELLNELIRQKPAHVGTALRDWVAAKGN
jgi:flagellar M-ring protein FliF